MWVTCVSVESSIVCEREIWACARYGTESSCLSRKLRRPGSGSFAKPSHGAHRSWGRGLVWLTGRSGRHCAASGGVISHRFPITQQQWEPIRPALLPTHAVFKLMLIGNEVSCAYLHPKGESLLWKSRRGEITCDICHRPVDQICDAGLWLYKTNTHQNPRRINQWVCQWLLGMVRSSHVRKLVYTS